ncbi:MAG: chorismate lyase [Rickettsiales bacterium]|jgi:chorismate--pyruvate lyase|nr:chorismate lyase [Rickettsiales bacterium]
MDFKVWHRATDEVVRELPYHIAEWVAEFGSLTQKLGHYVDKVRLDLLKEDKVNASPSESQILKLQPEEQAQLREVVLYGPEAPWIFARTLVPVSEEKLILDLGTTPLGSILFSSKELRRESLEVRRLDSNHAMFQQAKSYGLVQDQEQCLWARRSYWQNSQQASDGSQKKLLLLEVFLPASPLY